jgi:hypothetical protein
MPAVKNYVRISSLILRIGVSAKDLHGGVLRQVLQPEGSQLSRAE